LSYAPTRKNEGRTGQNYSRTVCAAWRRRWLRLPSPSSKTQ